jgi:hypothetical protein
MIFPIGSIQSLPPSIALWSGQVSYALVGPTLNLLLTLLQLIQVPPAVPGPQQPMGGGF